jgi:restriction system protein
MTILEAALKVLKSSSKPMSAQAIYDQICKEGLFEFGAKDPLAILKAQLRRNSLGFTGKSASSKPTLKQLADKTYTTL